MQAILISHLFSSSGRAATSLRVGVPPADPSSADFSVGVVFHTQGHQAPPSATHGAENQAKGMLPVNSWGQSPGAPAVELPFLLSLMKMEGKKKTAHCLLS